MADGLTVCVPYLLTCLLDFLLLGTTTIRSQRLELSGFLCPHAVDVERETRHLVSEQLQQLALLWAQNFAFLTQLPVEFLCAGLIRRSDDEP